MARAIVADSSASTALPGWRETYFVASNVELPNGRTLIHYRLSREFTSLGTCRRVFKRIRRSHPAAFMVRAHTLIREL